MSDSLVVCLHHPTDGVDLEAIRVALGETPRPVDLRLLPFRESVALRRARQSPPVPAELLAKAPVPSPEVRAAWERAEVVCTIDLTPEMLDAMPRLRWVQAYSAGLEQFPQQALAERGIRLTNAAGAGAPSIAEFVFGRLIEVYRNLRGIEAMQTERAFHRPGGRTLAGRTLGIVGLGAIGSEVARLGRAFGMKTLATRRSAKPGDTSDRVDRLLASPEQDELFANSDVLVLCAPASASTENLIDAAAIARMKPGAVIVNVARGALIDEVALREGLESGQLGAAVLDVTRQEPLPADDPLWNAPNLYLSPHSSIPPDAYDLRLIGLLTENLGRYLAGGALVNEIELTAASA